MVADSFKTFADLLDRLAYEPRRNAKIALLVPYFRTMPDPERGLALAAMTGGLSFTNAKAGLVRGLIEARSDPVLFRLSYDYVGDLSETVALLWPQPEVPPNRPAPTLAEVVVTLQTGERRDLAGQVAQWLDVLDETARWALLKLITGALRIGVSARLAKTALAEMGGMEPDAIEEIWHGLEPPYEALFAWVEGRGPRPEATDPAPFRPPMLAHPLEESDRATLDPSAYAAEWKWDGIRVQAAVGRRADGERIVRLYSRTGEDVAPAFPDLAEALANGLTADAALDGELLVMIDGRVGSFGDLQQRLNRKSVTPTLLARFPAHLRAYDLLAEAGEDLRGLPHEVRRARLERLVTASGLSCLDLSPQVAFADFDDLDRARLDPASAGAGADAAAIEGCMLKLRTSPYLAGRPKGPWFKWKRAPHRIDCVLMYAQRGHGKRSSFYSDFTFGCWREDGELVPVGKAYSGFTDAELAELDRFVRKHTLNRFGPVREVVHTESAGLVLEVAFEGLQRSTRHKSGVAMRFPRIHRIRWDKPPGEADRLADLEKLLPASPET